MIGGILGGRLDDVARSDKTMKLIIDGEKAFILHRRVERGIFQQLFFCILGE